MFKNKRSAWIVLALSCILTIALAGNAIAAKKGKAPKRMEIIVLDVADASKDKKASEKGRELIRSEFIAYFTKVQSNVSAVNEAHAQDLIKKLNGKHKGNCCSWDCQKDALLDTKANHVASLKVTGEGEKYTVQVAYAFSKNPMQKSAQQKFDASWDGKAKSARNVGRLLAFHLAWGIASDKSDLARVKMLKDMGLTEKDVK